uniref:Uncharacterized protein n=1 Tax=Oryza nivara TaxID=4536 RepID=A0A0E0INS5_ORYNI
MTRGNGGAWRPRRGSLSAAAASRLLRVEGHDRRGRAVDAAGNSSRCRVPTLIYPRRGGDRDDSLDFSPSGRRSPVTISANANEATSHGETGKLEMPVVAASLAGNTIKRVSNCGNVTSESQIFSNPSRYKNLSLMRNPRHLGTSDIEKLYDKLRYSKFVKEHSSSGIFSSLFQLKSRGNGMPASFGSRISLRSSTNRRKLLFSRNFEILVTSFASRSSWFIPSLLAICSLMFLEAVTKMTN